MRLQKEGVHERASKRGLRDSRPIIQAIFGDLEAITVRGWRTGTGGGDMTWPFRLLGRTPPYVREEWTPVAAA